MPMVLPFFKYGGVFKYAFFKYSKLHLYLSGKLTLLNRYLLSYVFTFLLLNAGIAHAQQSPVYQFPKDDSLIKKQYLNEAQAGYKALLTSLDKEYKKQYEEVYKERFDLVKDLLESSRSITYSTAHTYLQELLAKITNANPELKTLKIRLLFNRDWWPNAYSIGDGTLTVNAGLMIYLKNEAELVFVLCHELSHLYLDHGNKSIKKYIEKVNSDDFKNEIKKLSKKEYNVNAELDKLLKQFVFSTMHHSRENEAEADKKALEFMQKTGFNCNAAVNCLNMLNNVDDTSIYKPLVTADVFNFTSYPFKKAWIQKESSIFSEMKESDDGFTAAEKDSIKTHPDCLKRIALLKDKLLQLPDGNDFIVNSETFKKLKDDFLLEINEETFTEGKITRNLYYSLQLLQNGNNVPYAVYAVTRALNRIYAAQRNHTLGNITEKETRGYPADYNLLLRIIDRLRLDEVAAICYNFVSLHKNEAADYPSFNKELDTAEKNFIQQ